MGAGFGRLWTASTAGDLGDGVGRVAIALLAAQLTREPMAVAVITALSYLPWLVLGLPAGVLVDRYDRRMLALAAGGLRAVAVAVLVVAAAGDWASLWLLYGVVVILYSCETVYDNAVSSTVPMVVADHDDLERANGRMEGARLVAQQFIGPPLAGLVFALAAAAAFGIHLASYVVAVLLLLTLPGSYRAARREDTGAPPRPPSMFREMADGLRYLRAHPVHRPLLALMMALGFGGAMVNATMVLWAQDVLGVSEALYGVFGLTMAVGALAGSQTAAAVARRAGRGRSLWITMVVAGVGGLLAAATTSPYFAAAGLVVVGWANVTFNVVNVSLRQRLTEPELLGRVMGTYRAATISVMLIGAVAGGAVASLGGLRLPWLVFGVGFLLTSALTLCRLRSIDRAAPPQDAGGDADGDDDQAEVPSR
ncbi:MAG: MFS transporter [Natronosporangium sp.]